MTQRYYRKIIKISAEDTPNVRYALAQQKAGFEPSDTVKDESGNDMYPGILTWNQYKYRRATWDKIRQSIGLDGRFWEGGETLMFPPQWLNRSERLWIYMRARHRIARGVGIDSGEGTANTAVAIVDEYGLIELTSVKTPNTDDIITITLDTIHRYSINPERVLFDRGGGGKQHADRLRAMGYNVRTIGFGDKPSIEPKRGKTFFNEKVDTNERRYAYLNRRSEMYGSLRILLDPMSDDRDYDSESAWTEVAEERGRVVGEIRGFTINPEYNRLREQLAPIPLLFDSEGRMRMLPKNKSRENSTERTLIDIIGYSPDEADALVLAIHAMQMSNIRNEARIEG